MSDKYTLYHFQPLQHILAYVRGFIEEDIARKKR